MYKTNEMSKLIKNIRKEYRKDFEKSTAYNEISEQLNIIRKANVMASNLYDLMSVAGRLPDFEHIWRKYNNDRNVYIDQGIDAMKRINEIAKNYKLGIEEEIFDTPSMHLGRNVFISEATEMEQNYNQRIRNFDRKTIEEQFSQETDKEYMLSFLKTEPEVRDRYRELVKILYKDPEKMPEKEKEEPPKPQEKPKYKDIEEMMGKANEQHEKTKKKDKPLPDKYHKKHKRSDDYER